jgi:energy-coupling factor transport system permease protein
MQMLNFASNVGINWAKTEKNMDLLRSLPIGLYLEKPITWLHYLDARVKLAWLMTFLAAPLLANPYWRIGIASILCLLAISSNIPWRVWRQQTGWLFTLCILVFIIACFASDGLGVSYQPRLPDSTTILPQPTDYQYTLFQQGRFTITRRSLDLAIRVSTLVFTLIYSTNLYLLTTAPEEITAGLQTLFNPLTRLKIPITEIILTLTLSLRFIPLVLEEIQNLTRSVTTRAINWKKLGFKKSLRVWLMVAEKMLENLLLRAEQIAIAMDVRGFTSPNEHKVEWHQLHVGFYDWIALGTLLLFWIGRIAFGGLET